MNTEFQFNKLFVIESLGDEELHTGTHVVEELVRLMEQTGMGLTFWKATTASDFKSALLQTLQQVRRSSPKTYPILQIDAHGAEDGIFLSSGEVYSWNDFTLLCREINVACENNLVVVASLCHGISAITEVTVREVTPFFALLGPTSTIKAVEADAMSAFYRELLRDQTIEASLKRIRHKLETYLCERLLLNAFAGYIRDNRTGARRAPRVERLLTDVRSLPSTKNIEIGELRRRIKEHVLPTEQVYEQWKASFLMADHPSNTGRFMSTFSDTEAIADSEWD